MGILCPLESNHYWLVEPKSAVVVKNGLCIVDSVYSLYVCSMVLKKLPKIYSYVIYSLISAMNHTKPTRKATSQR